MVGSGSRGRDGGFVSWDVPPAPSNKTNSLNSQCPGSRRNQNAVTIFLLEAYFLGLVGLWHICAAVKEDRNWIKSVRWAFSDLIKRNHSLPVPC